MKVAGQGWRLQWREDAFGDKHLAVGNAMVEIDAEGGDGGPTRSCPADQARAVPVEVPRPFLAARVEEGDDFVRSAVYSGYIRSFIVIAGKTGQAKIVRLRGAAVAFGDDMVDLKRRIVELLGHLAILAVAARTLPYELFQRAFHA